MDAGLLLLDPPRWQRWLRPIAIPLSILIHIVLAVLFLSGDLRAATSAGWIEMAVMEPPPPEPVKEKPQPQPRKEAPKPLPDRPAEIKEAPPQATPDKAPDRARVVRRIQGLSSSSFAAGSGTSFAARAGTTTRAAAGRETLGLDEADDFNNAAVPVSTVATPPKNCTQPPIQVPKEAIDANVEGTLNASIDIDAQGRVFRVRFLNSLGYGTEEACKVALLQMHCKPGMQDDVPVAVKGIVHRCEFRATD
jgi:outer membrane biosynthesis protein TonB